MSPLPLFIHRAHNAQINAIAFSPRANKFLYSGDADGWVSIIDTRSRRTVVCWRAHQEGVLAIEEWADAGCLLTSGRDNKLHRFQLPDALPSLGNPSSSTAPSPPILLSSMDINALNYCKFSLLPLATTSKEPEGWVALPNLTDSETIDVFHLPSQTRPHAAIGFTSSAPDTSLGRGALDADKTGLMMSIHFLSSTSLLAGTESGHVICFAYQGPPEAVTDARLDMLSARHEPTSQLPKGRWVRKWKVKIHREAVMGLAISPLKDFALSVSADHQIVKYNLSDPLPPGSPRHEVHKITQLGNASIDINSSGRVCAVAGWDGNIRLFSTRSFKPLGTLPYHRDTCHILAFAHTTSFPVGDASGSDSEEDEREDGQARRERWLASGGVDKRVAVWELMDFERKGPGKRQ